MDPWSTPTLRNSKGPLQRSFCKVCRVSEAGGRGDPSFAKDGSFPHAGRAEAISVSPCRNLLCNTYLISSWRKVEVIELSTTRLCMVAAVGVTEVRVCFKLPLSTTCLYTRNSHRLVVATFDDTPTHGGHCGYYRSAGLLFQVATFDDTSI